MYSTIFASALILGAVYADQQFETLQIANLLNEQMNWNDRQHNWARNSRNKLASGVTIDENSRFDSDSRHHHTYTEHPSHSDYQEESGYLYGQGHYDHP